MRRLLSRWIVPLVLLAGLLYLAFLKLDLGAVSRALVGARWPPLVGSLLLAATVCMGGAIFRLHTLLAALPHARPLGRGGLASIQFAASAAHNLLPAPAGEVVRTVQLRRQGGYDVGTLVGAQLVEKVIEALGLGLGTLAMALFGRLPASLADSMYAFSALGVGGALLALAVGWRSQPSRPPPVDASWLRRLLRRLADAIHALGAPSVWWRALLWSLLSDLANAATVGLCLAAVGLSLPVAAWFLVMLATRAAGLAPSTPGQFGVQEAGAVVALGLVGVERNRALAVALLHHMTHFLPITLVGLWELRRQWVTNRPESTP